MAYAVAILPEFHRTLHAIATRFFPMEIAPHIFLTGSHDLRRALAIRDDHCSETVAFHLSGKLRHFERRLGMPDGGAVGYTACISPDYCCGILQRDPFMVVRYFHDPVHHMQPLPHDVEVSFLGTGRPVVLNMATRDQVIL